MINKKKLIIGLLCILLSCILFTELKCFATTENVTKKIFATNKSISPALDEFIQRNFEEYEYEGETYYINKSLYEPIDTYISYSTSGVNYTGNNKKAQDIVYNLVDEYAKSLTKEDCDESKRIKADYSVVITHIYSVSEEEPFVDGEDIVALAYVSAKAVKGDSDYWKNTLSNNELYYNDYRNEYYVKMCYFIRATKNNESNKYEIAYLDFKPENFDERLDKLNEEKGIDLKNLDVEKVLNTRYTDKIEAVASTTSVVEGGEKTEYNNMQIEEISNISSIIKIVCTTILVLIILLLIKKIIKRK